MTLRTRRVALSADDADDADLRGFNTERPASAAKRPVSARTGQRECEPQQPIGLVFTPPGSRAARLRRAAGRRGAISGATRIRIRIRISICVIRAIRG